MTTTRWITEMGMGVDVHGSDYTKAAKRAVSDALRHSSLHFFQATDKTVHDMHVEVRIGVAEPHAVDTDAVAAEVPYGTVTITVQPGGLDVPAESGPDGIVIANAAILVSFEDSVTITTEDFLTFCDRTIGFHVDAVRRLDDDQVNTVPDLPGANSPFRLVTHALAACDWWTSHIVCGHPSSRDRDAEFEASGTVGELEEAATAAVARLRELAPELAAATELAHPARTSAPLAGDWTVGAALIHAYEELAQHLGHLEITVDLILAGE